MEEHFVYVIYKDGKPLDHTKVAGMKRNAYMRPGDAKSIITSLCSDEIWKKYRLHRYSFELFDEKMEELRSHYKIVKYAAVGSLDD